jgi:RNA polymerase sigma-70 factor (ECF subfamily)
MDGSRDVAVADLIARAREGDAAGRDRLFAACRSWLDILAAAQVEGRLQARMAPSDLVQETLLEAHRDFDRFRGGTTGEWLAWLRRILARNAADAARRYHGTAKRAGREVPIGPADDSAAPRGFEPAAAGPSPSEEFLLRDTELRVAAALAGLTADHRQVIVLRNLERLPFDEIARRMGRTRPAVQMLWMRAVRKLEAAVADPP